jgi:hypothetical protein
MTEPRQARRGLRVLAAGGTVAAVAWYRSCSQSVPSLRRSGVAAGFNPWWSWRMGLIGVRRRRDRPAVPKSLA